MRNTYSPVLEVNVNYHTYIIIFFFLSCTYSSSSCPWSYYDQHTFFCHGLVDSSLFIMTMHTICMLDVLERVRFLKITFRGFDSPLSSQGHQTLQFYCPYLVDVIKFYTYLVKFSHVVSEKLKMLLQNDCQKQ